MSVHLNRGQASTLALHTWEATKEIVISIRLTPGKPDLPENAVTGEMESVRKLGGEMFG